MKTRIRLARLAVLFLVVVAILIAMDFRNPKLQRMLDYLWIPVIR